MVRRQQSRPHRVGLVGVVAGALVTAVLSSPSARAAQGAFAQPVGVQVADEIFLASEVTGMTIPAAGTDGPANPYPSQITVSGQPGTITDIDVGLLSFDHTFPDNVDVLLVGPGGQQATLVSDVGGADDAVGLNLAIDDEAPSPLPDADALVTGIYQPTNFGALADPHPAPAPTVTGATALSVFDGTSANGTWSLFVVDDFGGDVGDLSGGWALGITQAPSTDPYPSSLTVSGLPAGITDVNLSLTSYDHPNPDDVDVMLVGPGGHRVVVMSDVGGGTDVADANITFDDQAAAGLPDGGPAIAGTFRPTNIGASPDPFPSPAPDAAGAAPTLAAFDGTDPNGTWRLFVIDDFPGGTGDISGGWSLQITTADIPDAPVITAPSSPSTDADGTIQLAGTAPVGSTVRVRDGTAGTASTVAGGTGAWSVSLVAVPDGTHTYTATATDRFGNVSAASAPVDVRVDTRHPKAVRVRPARGADDVRRAANVRASFSEAVRRGTLTRANVRLVRAGTARAVRARVTYDPILRKVKINPRRPLAADTRYRAIVTTRVRDLAGNSLDQRPRPGNQRLVWRFATR